MAQRIQALAGPLLLALVLGFLYLPIAVLALMGFNESVHYALPFRFSTEWYVRLAGTLGLARRQRRVPSAHELLAEGDTP